MGGVKVKKQGTHIDVSNNCCNFNIDTSTGMLKDFSLFGSPHGQWDDIVNDKLIYRNAAGIRVRDELADAQYTDPFGMSRVFYHEPRKLILYPKGAEPECADFKITRRKDCTLITFSKRYPGADFSMRHEFAIHSDFIRWDIELELDKGAEERSLKLEYALPLFRSVNGNYFPKGWKLWAPLQDAPYDFGHIGGWGHSQASWYAHRFPYCSTNAGAGIGVPIMDVYNGEVGLALCAPLEEMKPEMVFTADKETSQLGLSYGNIGLRPGVKPHASLLLVPHKGDWRQALGWYKKKYQTYFEPADKKILQQEGTMFYGMPNVPEKTIKSWVKHMKLKWTEVLYNPIFGDYTPDAATWNFEMLWSEKNPEKIIRGLTKEKIKDYLALLKRNGVASFVYYNYGECDRELAEREFPESILHNDHCLQRAWMFRDGKRGNVVMNPDPDSKWGRHVLKQAEDIFKIYKDMDGLFIDQICYHNYDYAQDDGQTLVCNRRTFDTHAASCRMMDQVHAILKKYRKTCFANGPYNIEVMRHVDGIMSEGSLAGLAKLSYMCLDRPVMILTYGKFSVDFENTLKYCLKYGAFPSTPYHHDQCFNPPAVPPRETLALYEKYLPLLEKLRGRKWVLESEAVTFPAGLDGNVFQLRSGGYAVPFFTIDALLSNKYWNRSNPREIVLRLPGVKNVKTVKWFSVETKKERTLPVSQAGGKMTVAIPECTVASVLIF
jgi:hypothetical protein